jgi:mono/diheme cytochrome c family protein
MRFRFYGADGTCASARLRASRGCADMRSGFEAGMNKIRGAHIVLLAPLMAGMAISTNSISAWNGSQRTPPAGNPQVERGRYLVEEVAKCPECHTPRNERGELRQDAWLSGAPIWIQPVSPIRNWADRAPAFPEFYRRARGTNSRKGHRTGRRGNSPADAYLPHESRRREGHYCLSQIVAPESVPELNCGNSL